MTAPSELYGSCVDQALARHGLVSFSVRPTPPVLPGTTNCNNADIYFEFNPPVRTPDAVLVVENSTAVRVEQVEQGAISLQPDPAKGRIFIASEDGRTIREVVVLTVDARIIRRIISNIRRLEVDLDGLSAGTYLLSIRTNEGNWHQRRFVAE